jgi:23S rRNA (cytosine1962-C5)-methyltransferase
MKTDSHILILEPQPDYELIDSGEGEKLERLGDVIMIRPDPQALWLKSQPDLWVKADVHYVRTGPKSGEWKRLSEKSKQMSDSWMIKFGGLNFEVYISSFKHIGIFPEHKPNWDFFIEQIKNELENKKNTEKKEIQVLNLFGYTGGASLACAQAGAHVTHVDSSKSSITSANKNAELSGLKDKPIRWILEDAFAFVQKEVRRGKKYDGILMDPPSFGHGTKGEVWKIEKQFTDLVSDTMKLISDNPIFFAINGYAAGYSPIAYANNILNIKEKFGGQIEYGELTIQESQSKRLLPAGIFARWSKLG